MEAPASSYAGGLIGQASYANTVKVAGCYSSAAVSGPYRTGGLIGAVSGTNFTLENCYATGDVTASGGYAGGLIGYVSCTGSYALDAENCYAAGTVTGGTSYGFTYVYGNTGAFTNCYYDSNNSTAQPEDDKYAGVTGLATPDLQAAAATLGGAFQQDSEGLNNGYPILKWQDPNATYQIVLTVEPQNAEVELTSATEGTPLTADSAVDGVYTYSGLASGSAVHYTVSQSAGASTDYAPASGVITIGKADVARTITLQPNRYDMTFTLTPAEAVLEVKDSAGEPLSPTEEAGLTYSVTNGSYTYNAQAFGYKTLEDSVVIDKAGQEVAIVLEEQDSQQVTFVFDPAGQDIQNRSLTVTAQLEESAKTMTPDEDGGLTYTLPVGYRYQYVFRASNYAKQTGEIDLTAAAGGVQQQQTISFGAENRLGRR